MNMNFLVLGCNGMAGHIISLYLKEKGHNVVGFARSKSDFIETIIGDATDFELLKKIIRVGNYDIVVNAIGILNKFAESNHSLAVLMNSYLPHYLAQVTSDLKTRIFHMSTDCVFSGKKGKYTEQSVPDGTLFYDRTKALGELVDDKNLTLRNSIVGPDIKESGIGLLNWFLKQKTSVNGFTKAIWTGQTTLQLAKTIEMAAQNNVTGLFNMVPRESINKYELLKLFNKYIREDEIEIRPVDTFVIDKSLVRTNYNGFEYEIPDYETMVKELGVWMRNHKNIYPHYNI